MLHMCPSLDRGITIGNIVKSQANATKIKFYFRGTLFTKLGYGLFPKSTQDYGLFRPPPPLTGPH